MTVFILGLICYVYMLSTCICIPLSLSLPSYLSLPSSYSLLPSLPLSLPLLSPSPSLSLSLSQVKKGLEKLYKRCDKDLSEESGRLRVVWGAMQEAFINQYDHFTKLIQKCYPGSNVQLEFKMDDIIEYFRSISDD